MIITHETYPYGPDLLGHDGTIVSGVSHLLHELRFEYNVQFEFECEINENKGQLAFEGKTFKGDAKEIKTHVHKWMWDRFREHAAGNIEKLKALFPHDAVKSYYCLGYPTSYNRPYPNVTIYWEPFQDKNFKDGYMYAHDAIFRFFELHQPWEALEALVKTRVDMSNHYTSSKNTLS